MLQQFLSDIVEVHRSMIHLFLFVRQIPCCQGLKKWDGTFYQFRTIKIVPNLNFTFTLRLVTLGFSMVSGVDRLPH